MDLINSIKRNESIRESLIRLKASSQCDSLLQKDQQFKQKLIEFLSHEDPKVRKNSAILVPAKRRYSKALHAVYTPKLVPR